MGFGDLKSKSGLESLNKFLADRSYIEGYQPSQADTVVFSSLSGAPAKDLVHALRWYNQIKSYSDKDRTGFSGQKKNISTYGPGGDAAPAADDDEDSDDVDLFGSDNEEEDEIRKKRLADYAAKKAKKPGPIAKSSIILDVKPWDDETDMAVLEKCVRSIEEDGLLWKASKLVPVGYGIKKLQINCVVEDDKISTDLLEEQITGFEDYVQSMDIVAFNKV
ncbi:hypothetical protein ScPMuIL_016716 [Solemya velum]